VKKKQNKSSARRFAVSTLDRRNYWLPGFIEVHRIKYISECVVANKKKRKEARFLSYYPIFPQKKRKGIM
jgi:hypothetical protein